VLDISNVGLKKTFSTFKREKEFDFDQLINNFVLKYQAMIQ